MAVLQPDDLNSNLVELGEEFLPNGRNYIENNLYDSGVNRASTYDPPKQWYLGASAQLLKMWDGFSFQQLSTQTTLLTSGRVPYVDSNGQLTDDADLTFSIDTLTLTKLRLLIGSSTSYGNVGGTKFDHLVDANNGTTVETDLYTDTVPASTLASDGDKLLVQYGGIFTGAVSSTQQLRMYFGGTLIFDSGALSIGVATDSWNLNATCIRVSGSVVRCVVSLTTNFATLSSYAVYTEVTGLTLTNTQVLKITGQAAGIGAASNQITAKEGTVLWQPKA